MSRGANWQFDIFEPRDKKVNCNRVFLASFRLENIFHLKNRKMKLGHILKRKLAKKHAKERLPRVFFRKSRETSLLVKC